MILVVQALADLTSSDLHVPEGSFTPENKKKVLEDTTIDWLLTHDPSHEELNDGVMMTVCLIWLESSFPMDLMPVGVLPSYVTKVNVTFNDTKRR
jgi:hypothetical protein